MRRPCFCRITATTANVPKHETRRGHLQSGSSSKSEKHSRSDFVFNQHRSCGQVMKFKCVKSNFLGGHRRSCFRKKYKIIRNIKKFNAQVSHLLKLNMRKKH